MKSLIYGPVYLWEMHFSQVVDIAWQEYHEGRRSIILFCNKFFHSCPININNLKWRCSDCIHQSKYSQANLFPPGTEFRWLEKRVTKIRESRPKDFSYEYLLNYRYKGYPLGLGVISHLVSVEKDMYLTGESSLINAHDLLQDAIELYEESIKLLKGGIDRVYLWGGRRMTEAPVLFASRKLNIRTYQFEIGYKPKSYFVSEHGLSSFSGTSLTVKEWISKRKLSTELEVIEDQGREFYEQLERGTSQVPHYKWFQENNRTQMTSTTFPIDYSKKILVIFFSTFWENIAYPDYTDISQDFVEPFSLVERIANDDYVTNSFNILIRWHPNQVNTGVNESARIERCIAQSPLAIHIRPSDPINSYSILDASDVVVTFGSTMGIESAARFKPTILLGQASYKNLGSVYEPKTYDEFIKLLKRNLKPLSKSGALIFGDFLKNFGSPFKFVDFVKGKPYLEDKKVRIFSKRERIRNYWFRLKHSIKKGIMSISFLSLGTKLSKQ